MDYSKKDNSNKESRGLHRKETSNYLYVGVSNNIFNVLYTKQQFILKIIDKSGVLSLGLLTLGYWRVKKVSRLWMRRESVPHRGLMMDTPGTSSSGSGGSTFLCSRHFLGNMASARDSILVVKKEG